MATGTTTCGDTDDDADTLEICTFPKLGRGVVTKKAAVAGDVLIKEVPYLAISTLPSFCCATCLVQLGADVRRFVCCEHSPCSVDYYCSTLCRDRHRAIHTILCGKPLHKHFAELIAMIEADEKDHVTEPPRPAPAHAAARHPARPRAERCTETTAAVPRPMSKDDQEHVLMRWARSPLLTGSRLFKVLNCHLAVLRMATVIVANPVYRSSAGSRLALADFIPQFWQLMPRREHCSSTSTSSSSSSSSWSLSSPSSSFSSSSSSSSAASTNSTSGSSDGSIVGGSSDESISDCCSNEATRGSSIESIDKDKEVFNAVYGKYLQLMHKTLGTGTDTRFDSRWYDAVFNKYGVNALSSVVPIHQTPRVEDGGKFVVGTVLYLYQSTINHGCVPNVKASLSTIVALRSIEAGEQLFRNYLDTQQAGKDGKDGNDAGTLPLNVEDRLMHLAVALYFFCACPLCTKQLATQKISPSTWSSLKRLI